MSKTKIKSKESILERILSSLDSTWAKLTIIGAIGFVGFKAGCYYQETIMTRKQNAEYQQQTDAWVQKEEYYRDKIQELRLKVVELEKRVPNNKMQQ